MGLLESIHLQRSGHSILVGRVSSPAPSFPCLCVPVGLAAFSGMLYAFLTL